MTGKHRRVWLSGLLMALVAALVVPTVVLAAGGPPQERGYQATGVTPGMGYNYVATGDLDADEQAALAEFLFDEVHALAVYESVMAQFGEIQPFASVARAEEQHIAAVESIYSRYGIALPEIPSFDVPTFATDKDACAAAAQAEIDNAGLYDRLMSTFDNTDVLRVASNLQSASLNSHLPAFEACADSTYTAGTGIGYRGGMGYAHGNAAAPRLLNDGTGAALMGGPRGR